MNIPTKIRILITKKMAMLQFLVEERGIHAAMYRNVFGQDIDSMHDTKKCNYSWFVKGSRVGA